MTRLGTWFWLLLAASTGFAMFMVKYGVQNLEDELVRVRKHTVAEQLEIRVLNAEWTYLNQPERLSDLNRQLFNLTPVTIKQLQHTIAELPLRPPPALPVDTVAVAEAPVPAVPIEPRPTEPGPPAAASAVPEPAIAPAVLRQTADAAPPRPSPVRTTPTLDALFAQVAGER